METKELFSNEFLVRWDEEHRCLFVVHPDRRTFPEPLVTIRESTLSEMNFEAAAEFIGSRLALLMPALRDRYVDPATGLLRGAGDA